MDVEYLHVCEWAFMTEGRRHGIIGIFNEVEVNAFLSPLPYFSIAAGLYNVPAGDRAVSIVITTPSGDVIVNGQTDLVRQPGGTAVISAALFGAQAPEPGPYTVQLKAGARVLKTQTLRVTRR